MSDRPPARGRSVRVDPVLSGVVSAPRLGGPDTDGTERGSGLQPLQLVVQRLDVLADRFQALLAQITG
jgi:hypothetical protein